MLENDPALEKVLSLCAFQSKDESERRLADPETLEKLKAIAKAMWEENGRP